MFSNIPTSCVWKLHQGPHHHLTLLLWEWKMPLYNCQHTTLCVCVCVCVRERVIQLCLCFCNPMDCCLPGSSVHGIFQARILEWVAIPFFGDLPNPGIEPRSPALQSLYHLSIRGKKVLLKCCKIPL